MRSKIIASSAVLLLIGGAQAQLVQVVPNDRATVAGGATFLGPLANSGRTYQWLIADTELTSLVGQQLSGITYRLGTSASSAWPTADVTYTNYDIYLSPGVAPAARSLTFANNVAGPQTQVRSGPLTILTGSFTVNNNPRDFGVNIDFGTPYLYTGGNLLIELRHSGSSGTSSSVDAVGTTGTGYGTAFSACWTGNYTGTTGAAGNFAVIQLTATAVPEPGSLALCGLGVIAAGGRLLRKRKSS